jgi:glycosyltransferase involved in cell wall biosynthesis
MRVLFDVPAFVMGGMERQIVDVASGLVSRGHEVALVVNKNATDAYHDLIQSGGVGLTVLGRTNRLDPRVLTDLLGIAHRFAPDVVVCETFNASLWGRLAGIMSGAAVVVAEHASGGSPSRKEYWTNRALGAFTHSVVGCARAQVPSLIAEGHPEGAIVIVHNGVDTTFFRRDPAAGLAFRAELDVPADAFVIGMVAAHRREKRYDRLVALAERLSEAGLDFVACAIGGGPGYEADRAFAAASAAAGRIRFVGPRSDMAAVYSACDVAILLSDSETFPLAFLEAQACGTPVVGMDVGGAGETLDPGVSGVLVGQGDIAAMAESIKDLSSDPGLRRRMGNAGRSFIESHLTLDRMVDGYEAVLQEAAGTGIGHRGARRAARPRRR